MTSPGPSEREPQAAEVSYTQSGHSEAGTRGTLDTGLLSSAITRASTKHVCRTLGDWLPPLTVFDISFSSGCRRSVGQPQIELVSILFPC
jgi:hypothetical protein